MSRIFIDGFEGNNILATGLWDGIFATPTITTGITGMDGTYCLSLNSSAGVSKTIVDTATLYGACLVRITNVGGPFIIYTKNSAQSMVRITRNGTSYCIEVYRDSTLIATGTHPVNINTTYLLEFYIYIHDTTGRVTVKLDGITDIDFTGDTKPSTQTTINIFMLSTSSGSSYIYYDNIVLDNAAWIGNTKIQIVYPTGAGTTTQWTPSAGSNYACVDEIPYSDTDWVETNTIDLIDTYATSDLTGTITSIKCVQIEARCIKEGAPTPLNVDLAVRSGGTDYFSADIAVPSGYKALFNIWETDPATAAAWTEANVNLMEIGIKSKT
jgi:hypothetical protein